MSQNTELHELRTQYRRFALAPDTLFLLNSDDALRFIESATALGTKLAGVEGFSITDAGAYEPRQEFSNDCIDWPGETEKYLQRTRELLRRGKGSGIRFQLVFEDE